MKYCLAIIKDLYWENGKVKQRTIANISKCSSQEIYSIKMVLDSVRLNPCFQILLDWLSLISSILTRSVKTGFLSLSFCNIGTCGLGLMNFPAISNSSPITWMGIPSENQSLKGRLYGKPVFKRTNMETWLSLNLVYAG